jgi:uncharacterized protein
MPAQLPKPLVDAESRPYWEGLSRGELLIQRCEACSRFVFYPRSLCPHCSSDQLSWVRASGNARIYSYTVAHQAFGPFADKVPFVVAIVELEEGVRMLTRIIGAPREQVQIGAPVRVTFEAIDEGVTLPYFRLAL